MPGMQRKPSINPYNAFDAWMAARGFTTAKFAKRLSRRLGGCPVSMHVVARWRRGARRPPMYLRYILAHMSDGAVPTGLDAWPLEPVKKPRKRKLAG